MTDKERCFVEEYLIDLNATGAALRAGYKPGAAAHAAEWIHPEHPSKPRLRDLVDAELAQRSKRTGISADRVLRELARIAFADPLDIIGKDGGLKAEIDREDRSAIAGYRVRQGEGGSEKEVRLVDKARALELLGKHLGMFRETVQVDGAVPVVLDDIPRQAIGLVSNDGGSDDE